MIIAVLYVQYNKNSIENFNRIKSSFDDEVYKTHAEFMNNGKAANTMASINHSVIILFKYLIRLGDDKKPEVARMLKRYDWQKMVENSPNNSESSTSYMEDKGEIFALCLREKKAPHKFHEFNILLFVVLHELSHLMTVDFGHHKQFWIYFKYLLTRASEIGLYRPVDYKKHPVNYCGLDVTFNPLYSNL